MANEKIVVFYKPLGFGAHHKYVLYIGADGAVKGSARLGSSSVDTADFYGKGYPAEGLCLMGKLYGYSDNGEKWNSGNHDWDPTDPFRGYSLDADSERKFFISADSADLSVEWEALRQNIATDLLPNFNPVAGPSGIHENLAYIIL